MGTGRPAIGFEQFALPGLDADVEGPALGFQCLELVAQFSERIWLEPGFEVGCLVQGFGNIGNAMHASSHPVRKQGLAAPHHENLGIALEGRLDFIEFEFELALAPLHLGEC